jgi:hypothetical protein
MFHREQATTWMPGTSPGFDGKCVTPAKQSFACMLARSPCLPDENVENLSKHLNWNDGSANRQAPYDVEGDAAPVGSIHAFRVSQKTGVERDLHRSSS